MQNTPGKRVYAKSVSRVRISVTPLRNTLLISYEDNVFLIFLDRING